MPIDDDSDDELLRPASPLPPDDRLWRHPSELGGGTPPPSSWPTPPTVARPRRGMQAAALASAALAGTVVAMSVMWITRPTRVEVRQAKPTAVRAVTTAVFSPAALPSQALANDLAPSLVHVSAAHGEQWAEGSGVWLDGEGTLVVATPLVDGSDDIMVTGPDGNRVQALPLSSDPATGVTVLQVPDETGTPVTASSEQPDAGQPVAIIGAVSFTAQGQDDQRVMAGRVSATGVRTTVSKLVLHDALQLDRAVPDDAVGGVVVDAKGRLLGIVLAATGDQQLAVAVPADQALSAARSLRDDGTVRRAWLGVEVVDITPSASKLLHVDGGAKLTSVTWGSPAAGAGIQVDDVIISVDGGPILDASDLVVALRSWKPGDHVTITWKRGKDTQSAELTLGG